MPAIQRIAPCLWFDDEAEDAVGTYTGIFPRSRIVSTSRYGEAGRELHGRPPGSVMTIAFELDGLAFTALNGGPTFRFNEAISLQINCKDQAEIDHYWTQLCEGGDPAARRCGWLKDRFGVSWQIVPEALREMVADPDTARSQRVMTALLQMTKLDLAALKRAQAG